MNPSRRDLFIEYIKQELYHGFALSLPETYGGTWGRIQSLVDEHREYDARGESSDSPLKRLVPTVASFLTSLPLEEAWLRYDAKYAVSKRRQVPPSFNEVRHILNLAQVMALAGTVEMVSFDGDQTLYSDGGNFGNNVPLARTIASLLQQGVNVILITAAGYGLEAPRYEQRVQGLLDFMKVELAPEAMQRFFVLGGECNFLFRCGPTGRLGAVPVEEWQNAEDSSLDPSLRPANWPARRTQRLLDVAEDTMRASVQELRLRATLIRKSRAVGIIPGGEESVAATPVGHGSNKMKKEALDEVVLRCQQAITAHLRREQSTTSPSPLPPLPPTTSEGAGAAEGASTTTPWPSRSAERVPFCAFNGGRDAWVDVGNKDIGVQAMQSFLKIKSRANCLHVGDQFLDTGNDVAARNCCPCIWILNPKETLKVLQILLGLKRLSSAAMGGGGSGGGGDLAAATARAEGSSSPELAAVDGAAGGEGAADQGGGGGGPSRSSGGCSAPPAAAATAAAVASAARELGLYRTMSPARLDLVPIMVPELALSSQTSLDLLARPPSASVSSAPASPIVKSASAVKLAQDLSDT